MSPLQTVEFSNLHAHRPATEISVPDSDVLRLQEILTRLRNFRVSYRFHVLTFSEEINEAVLTGVVEALSFQGCAIRLKGSSLGLLDFGEEALQKECFMRVVQDELSRHKPDKPWHPFTLDSIEGRTDELSSANDLLLLVVSCRAYERPRKADAPHQHSSLPRVRALG